MQNTHKEVHFTKCCVNKKKLVSTFNLGKNFLYIFPMFVFDKYWVNFAKLFLSSLINCSITSAQIKIYFPHNLSPDGRGNLNQIVTNLSSECIFLKGPFFYRQNWALERNCSSSYLKQIFFCNIMLRFQIHCWGEICRLFSAGRLKILSKVSSTSFPYFVLCATASHEFITFPQNHLYSLKWAHFQCR